MFCYRSQIISTLLFKRCGAFLGPACLDPGKTNFPRNANFETPLMAMMGEGKLSLAINLSTILVKLSYIMGPPPPTDRKPNPDWRVKAIEGSMFGLDHDRACSFFHMAYGEIGMCAQIFNTDISYGSRMRESTENPDGSKPTNALGLERSCCSILSFTLITDLLN